MEKSAHDASYDGVIRTVDEFIKTGLSDEVEVFIREAERPKKIYTTQGREYRDAIAAIEYGREVGRRKAVLDFQTKFETVRNVLKEKEPQLIERLDDWTKLYHDEAEYLSMLNKEGSEYDD